MVRLGSLLCVSIRLSDAFHVFAFRPFRLAKSLAQGKQDISLWPLFAPGRAVCFGCVSIDAGDDLPRIPRRGDRPELVCILEAPACAAVLAVWTAMVRVAALGFQHCGSSALSVCSPLGGE